MPSDPPRETPVASSPAETPGSEAPTTRIIKRYSNRKLYDTVESRYVTLPQIAVLVRKGEDVRIIDNNSKEDLTSVTLAQILYEEERKQSRALPLATLKNLIHTSGEKIISSLRESPVGKFMPRGDEEGGEGGEGSVPAESEGAMAENATTSTGTASGAQGADARDGAPGSNKFVGMLEQSKVSMQEWQHQVDQRVRKVLETISPTSQVEKLQTEVRRLTQRLEELEARLGHKPPPSQDEPGGE